jgi:anti-anti-sigma regulatory factor
LHALVDISRTKGAFIENHTNETGIKLSGHWNLSGVVHQIESLPTLPQLESGREKLVFIDCGEIRSVDMCGLQLLYVWMQCISLRGVKPELINLPEGMQQTIKQMGLEKCFTDFYTDVTQ